MANHKIQIGDVDCDLTVSETKVNATTVYVAEGKHLGKYFKAKGASELQAVVNWREIARLKAAR